VVRVGKTTTTIRLLAQVHERIYSVASAELSVTGVESTWKGPPGAITVGLEVVLDEEILRAWLDLAADLAAACAAKSNKSTNSTAVAGSVDGDDSDDSEPEITTIPATVTTRAGRVPRPKRSGDYNDVCTRK